MSSRRFSRTEIEEIVITFRLHLYNNGLLYGPYVIQNLMKCEAIFPLPSISTIKRILSRASPTAEPAIIPKIMIPT